MNSPIGRGSCALLALEVVVLDAAVARQIRDANDAGRLTAHGTLYKAVGRLADAGMLDDE